MIGHQGDNASDKHPQGSGTISVHKGGKKWKYSRKDIRKQVHDKWDRTPFSNTVTRIGPRRWTDEVHLCVGPTVSTLALSSHNDRNIYFGGYYSEQTQRQATEQDTLNDQIVVGTSVDETRGYDQHADHGREDVKRTGWLESVVVVVRIIKCSQRERKRKRNTQRTSWDR